jgi:Spy/CpxP family protein refolding chaperone
MKSTLTDEQLEKIAALKDNFLSKTAGKKVELKGLGRQLRGLLTKKEVNRQEAFVLQEKISTLRADLAKEKLAFRLDMMSVLTDEQREKIRHRMLMKQAFGGHKHHGRHFAFAGHRGGFNRKG